MAKEQDRHIQPICRDTSLAFKTWLAAIEEWAGATSCWYYILRQILRGKSFLCVLLTFIEYIFFFIFLIDSKETIDSFAF